MTLARLRMLLDEESTTETDDLPVVFMDGDRCIEISDVSILETENGKEDKIELR